MDTRKHHSPWTIATTLLLLLCVSGCKKPAPVELVDDEILAPEVELVNEPVAPLLGMEDVDSTRLFPPDPRKTFGHLLISGSVYDGLFLHREATLARGIFFDRSAPVVNILGDTVSYMTLDVGTLTLDGYELVEHEKRSAVRGMLIDTLLGVQYSLVTTSGPGITYVGNHSYRWQNPATTLPAPIEISFASPTQIIVTQPTTATKISLFRNLTVKWRGGAGALKIVVSDVIDSTRPKPLMRLRVSRNRGEVVIPSTILRLLPRNRAGFLFTFSSESSVLVRFSGYPDDVLVQASTNHSLYLQCTL